MNPNLKTNRGSVAIILLVALGVAYLFGPKVLNWVHPKPPVAQLDKAQQDLVAARAAAVSAQQSLDAMKRAEAEKRVALTTVGQQMVAGAQESNSRAPVTQETQLTGVLLVKAQISLAMANGALSQEKQSEILDIVAKALSGMQTQVDQAKALLAQKDVQIQQLDNAKRAAAAQVVHLSEQSKLAQERYDSAQATVSEKTQEVEQWAKKKMASDAVASGFGAQVHRLLWVIILVAGVWVLGPVLETLSRIAPSLKPLSNGLNSVLSYALSKQNKRLQAGIGQTLGEVRAMIPEAQGTVRDIADKYITDPAIQSKIRAIADSTHGRLVDGKNTSARP